MEQLDKLKSNYDWMIYLQNCPISLKTENIQKFYMNSKQNSWKSYLLKQNH